MIERKAAGIIFPNIHDDNLPDLVGYRTMGSLPFCGRYRMIDFCLSGMANAGMENIAVIAKRNYQSLMDHLGNGREWDLSRKRGGLVIFPPYGRENDGNYSGRIEAVASVLQHIEGLDEELVVMSDCDVAFNLNFKDLIAKHQASRADVTVVYEKSPMEEGLKKDNYAFGFNEKGFATEIRVNEYKDGQHNFCMNVFVINRKYLIGLVREAMVKNATRFVQDFLAPNIGNIKIFGYEFKGYRARIYDMPSYFKESLRVLSVQNVCSLFPPEQPIYTKIRDEAPVRYAIGARCVSSMVADGCIVEGDVENCVLFRGVRVGKGAKLKNCIIMQGSEIEEDVILENVITDKNVCISAGQNMRGAAQFPVFIAKGCTVM